jgi:hypothetical protein
MSSLNRRHLLRLSAGAGFGLGLGHLASAKDSGMFQQIMQRAALGDLGGMAYAADQVAKRTLVHIVLIDKTQTALFQQMSGTPPQGATAMTGIAQELMDFRGMPLTKLFAKDLQALPADVSVSMCNSWQSMSGGHSLQNSYVSDDLGGMNAAYEKLSKGTGLLGAVGFNLRASANESKDCFVGPARRALTTYSSVTDMATTLESSLLPLRDQKTLEMVRFMDKLVTSKFEMRDRLVALAGQIGDSIPKLKEAATLTETIPNPQNMAAMMTRPDLVMQQVRAVIELSKAGVAFNFMIAVPWNDTNGGGDLTTAGGQGRLDPFSCVPKIAQAMVELHKNIPNLVCVTTSDGGRPQGNGDQSTGMAFLTGPDTVVKNGIVGGASNVYTNTSELNNPKGTVGMSDGSKGVSSPADWYRTALSALGTPAPDGKLVSEALVKS